MYLLDTNVVSELRKSGSEKIDPRVESWARKIVAEMLWVSAITVLELEIGVLRVERRDELQGTILRRWMSEQVLPTFEARVLSLDRRVALQCARHHVPDPKADRDAMIAATAQVHGLIVVTRNVSDFEGLGVELLNPWE